MKSRKRLKKKKRKVANPVQIAAQLTFRTGMTPTKKGRQNKLDKVQKQKGWNEE